MIPASGASCFDFFAVHIYQSSRSFFKRKYKDVNAVQKVDFKIAQGEVVGFLGPNGAGKTTTLKMLAGLLHPTGGNASVLGFTPWELKSEYRGKLWWVAHGCPPAEMQRVVSHMAAQGAGLATVTDDIYPNPYNLMPTNVDLFFAACKAIT